MAYKRLFRLMSLCTVLLASGVFFSVALAQTFGGYDFPECTWYAATRKPDLLIFHGYAKDWDNLARQHGFPVVTTPVVGSIVVFEPGVQDADSTNGHVAFVERVIDQSTFEVSEYNWGLSLIEKRALHSRTAWTGSGVSFILHMGESIPPPPNLNLPPSGYWTGNVSQRNPDVSYPVSLRLQDCEPNKICGSTVYNIMSAGGIMFRELDLPSKRRR